MLPVDRTFHFLGELTLQRSRVLGADSQPNEDGVNWLFLKIGDRRYSFVYVIRDASPQYGTPFIADMAFTWDEEVKRIAEIDKVYDLFRAEEPIGVARLIKPLE